MQMGKETNTIFSFKEFVRYFSYPYVSTEVVPNFKEAL